jgi:hypothetical protein
VSRHHPACVAPTSAADRRPASRLPPAIPGRVDSRHTFVSLALPGGRSLAEVRTAAGQANVAGTSAYLHIVVDEEEKVGQLFRHE